ncbi:MAG: DUF5673 domain-containing protein [Patescibacteria group bacterium]|jgi:hypothetical protein
MADKVKGVPDKTDKVLEDLNEEVVLHEWEAYEREYKTRDKDFWITAIAILVIVSVIFLLLKEFFLVMALGSVLFLYYVLSTVPPEKVRNKITNRGVYFGDLLYTWDQLVRFWFRTSLGTEVMLLETNLKFPPQISLVIDAGDKEKIKKIVVKKIPLIESSPNFVDKANKWFGERLPLENREM